MWRLRCPRTKSFDGSSLSTHTPWVISIKSHAFKYHLHTDDSQIYIFSQDLFPELQSYNISTWMSNKHCKVHKSKTEPPKSPLKLALPGVFLIWLMAAPFFHSSGPNLAVIPTPPPLTPHVHLISKSCWIYIQRISRIQPFLTIFTATTLDHITSISLLGYGVGLAAGLSASALAPQSVLQSSQSNQIRSQIKPSVGPISLRGKTISL